MLTHIDSGFFASAIVRCQAKLSEIDQRIADLRRQIATAASVPAPVAGKRQMSAAARVRIAAAQRALWAAARKKNAASAEPKPAAANKAVLKSAFGKNVETKRRAPKK